MNCIVGQNYQKLYIVTRLSIIDHTAISLPMCVTCLISDPNDKVSYAKRMANGYLKSVGIGEYTPKTNNCYSKYGTNGPTHSDDSQKLSTSAATARWKRPNNGDDDFNFK